MHPRCLPFPFLLLLLSTLIPPSTAGDTINPATPLTDGETIISTGGTFELGFFSPEDSENRYIGIWFHNIPVQTVVWVANRATPIPDKTGVLTVSSNGTLVLSSASNTTFWSSSSSTIADSSNPVAQLLDSGNLVVGAAGWQSFDHPTDTLLAGMKLGGNLTGGFNRNLTAWKTMSDPSPGQYTFKMEPQGLPEFFLYRGSSRIYSSGPWNGLQLSGVPDLISDGTFTFSYVANQDEAYYTYQINKVSIISRLVLNETGVLQRYVWLGSVTGWSLFWTDPKEPCDTYATCGPFGFCNSNESPNCNCMQGFEPKSQQEWNLRDASGGCVRKTRLNCSSDGFLLMKNMKLPQSENASANPAVSLEQCKELCLKNCSCTAYASADVSGGGGGCFVWVGALIDLQEFEGSGQDLYIRLAASDLLSLKTEKSGKKGLAIGLGTASALLLLGMVGYCMRINNAKRGRKLSLPPRKRDEPIVFLARNYSVLGSAKDQRLDSNRSSRKDLDLLLFDMVTIMAATENFALTNKLGEGGFGPVYKGKLGDGQEIAVKRLARTSTQGLNEFKNEVILIAKLQHRNLVRLHGCCIHGEEKMLVYEFMHNGSLDTFIFDETKCVMLNWQKRFDIILGIARGLLYLHQDSRLRIIHRDLKASNILLDSNMNPKISDFGMARIFGGNQTDAYTRRVVGTYGYMSPEYAMDGIFSMKSDVFSFGVLVLEIVSGKKNRGMFQSDPLLNLLRHTWRLWKEGKSLELLDKSMGGSYIASEVLTCIHVSLLCVQERASDRPTMASVTMMLSSETSNIKQPNEPGFVFSKNSSDTKLSSNNTVNGITITTMDAR